MGSKPVFALTRAELFEEYQTSSSGISTAEAKNRIGLYGGNVLESSRKVSLASRWAIHAVHPMALLLWLAAGVSLLTRQYILGGVICLVVLVNASFSFWREYRAGLALDTLRKLLPAFARVLRAGEEQHVPTVEIVPGDVLILAEGDAVPADARIIQESGLRTNNAALTGESMPVRKTADASSRENLSELERPNLIFAGTSIAAGTCRAVVFSTGMLTEFGKISRLTQAEKEAPSPLQQEMLLATRRLTIASLVLSLVVFGVGFVEIHLPLDQAFSMAIGIMVAMLPEGLVPTVTLTLAMAVQRLAQRGVLVKKLASVETLGNISVICTDKSGTLTQNQVTVCQLWSGGNSYTVSGLGYAPVGKINLEGPAKTPSLGAGALPNGSGDLQEFLTAGLLCNNARLKPPTPEQPHWGYLGDQTEAALITLARKGELQETQCLHAKPRIHEIPFDARRKRMSTIHRCQGKDIAYVKGAPREVLQQCDSILIHGQAVPLDEQLRAQILAVNDGYARKSLRVLALARHEISPASLRFSEENVERRLTFLGLAAMMDPPRPEVAEAVERFQSAGIRLVMVTGDYGLTAESIARRIGMLSQPKPRIVTGAELDEMSDGELQGLLPQEVIYARMAPEHKLRLVAAFQAHGEVTAVIGDGVNDVPALRKADLGIAMGVGGSDVAREAADIVLMDDNLNSVVVGVQEGRAVYDNLRKFITYIFASNVPEIMPFVLASLFKIPLALRVPQILAIDLGTDLLPALALGMEKPEPDVLSRPPRKRSLRLFDTGLVLRAFLWLGGIETALCYLLFFAVYQREALLNLLPLPPQAAVWLFGDPALASSHYVYLLATTVFHAGVVMAQAGNAFACRSERGNVRWLGLWSNPALLGGIALEIGMILLMVYWTPLAQAIGHVPLPPGYWGILVLLAPALYGLERVRKALSKRLRKGIVGGRQ